MKYVCIILELYLLPDVVIMPKKELLLTIQTSMGKMIQLSKICKYMIYWNFSVRKTMLKI